MLSVSEAIVNMALHCAGSLSDIEHFLKVWAYAKAIGEQEGLDSRSQQILEYTAIVHDNACPDLKKQTGSAPWDLQEKYGPDLVREFYRDSGFDAEMLDRICFIVGHHHTPNAVDGLDFQVLLEADFLVNVAGSEKWRAMREKYRESVFRTQTGLALLDSFRF